MAELDLTRQQAELLSRFDDIWIHPDAMKTPLAQRVVALKPKAWSCVERPPVKSGRGMMGARDFALSKRRLWISPFQGRFFKRCPGARPGLMCCNYFVLNLGQQCDMDCSYCYLQSFLNFPALTLYSNLDQALLELKGLHAELPTQKVRVGTGEVVDSLSLDPLTLYSRALIAQFRDFPEWTLEFKTKSDFVEQFIHEPHAGNVIVSWSVNPEAIVAREEHRTASLERRLKAARVAKDHGFQIAFHLDPVIHHEGWQESYAGLVDAITSQFQPSEVNVLSLGGLRFQPDQRHLMRSRWGMSSLVTRAEMHPSQDGKLRYDQRLRSEMFEFILGRFRAHSQEWRAFLCMESPETWLSIDDQLPHKQESLKGLFDSRLLREVRRGEDQWAAKNKALVEVGLNESNRR